MQRKNYIFHYGSKTKKITGHNVVENSIDKIKDLNPSQLSPDQVIGGWVKLVNDKYTNRELRNAKPGKWILQFTAGSSSIDQAWKKLVEGVAENQLWEVKALVRDPKKPVQILCIYTIDQNNLTDIERVYDFLQQQGLVELHLNEEINYGTLQYKNDEVMKSKKEICLLTNQDILSEKKNRQQVEQKLQQASQKINALIQEFNQLKNDIDQTPHFYSFFYDTRYNQVTLDAIGKLKEKFLQEIANLPPNLRKHEEIKKLLTSQNGETHLIDFHRSKSPFLRIGATHTRNKINELLSVVTEESRLLKTFGRQY